jgi:hypothetical protein
MILAQTPEPKKPWESKTIWVNLIMAGLAFVPQIQVLASPEVIGGVFAAVNGLLRLVTKTGVTIK